MSTCLCMGGPQCCTLRSRVFWPGYYWCPVSYPTWPTFTDRRAVYWHQPNRWRAKQQRVRERRAMEKPNE